MSDSEFDLTAASTILPNNSTDTGFFFITGLVSILCKLCEVTYTKGHEVGDGRSDVE